MCCRLKQKSIRNYGRCVCLGSFLLALSGMGVAFMAVVLSGTEVLSYIPSVDFDPTDFIVIAGLLLCAGLVIIGVWGCLVTCITSRWCLGPFALTILVAMLAFFGIGGSIILLETNGD